MIFALLAGNMRAADAGKEAQTMVAEAKEVPKLSFWVDRGQYNMVRADFPGEPAFRCDSWCYESQHVLDFLGQELRTNGTLELRHRLKESPQAVLITDVIPEPGAVEFVGRIALAEDARPDSKLPEEIPAPNLCWQLRFAPTFLSRGKHYSEFVKRCFIFTSKSQTFLHETDRKLIPCRSANDNYQKPFPWVQMYRGAWQDIPESTPEFWADYSPDKYETTIIGAVSRDGKYLSALGNADAPTMSQAWHDCMHNNAKWLPETGPIEKRRWRVKIYLMENDPEKLLERFYRDFPEARRAK